MKSVCVHVNRGEGVSGVGGARPHKNNQARNRTRYSIMKKGSGATGLQHFAPLQTGTEIPIFLPVGYLIRNRNIIKLTF